MIVTVIVLGTFMATLSSRTVTIAAHTLGQEFHSSISTIQWVLTGYLLAFASVIPVTGWASERFGIRRIWIGALLLFIVGSILSGVAWSAESLIAFRVLQGIGGGMLPPVGHAILAQAAGPQRMGRVLSLIGVPMLIGSVGAPVVGGVLLSFGWPWIFFVNVPFGVVAIAAALWLLPPVAAQPAKRPDLRGLILLCSGVAIFIYGASLAATGDSLGSPRAMAGLAVGAGLVVGYVVHARARGDRALIDLALLRQRAFAAAAGTLFVIAVARSGGLFLLPLYWQIVQGESPLETGLVLAPQAAGAAFALVLTGWVTDRLGAAVVVPVGVVCFLLGAGVYTQVSTGIVYSLSVAALFVLGFGQSAVTVPSTVAAYATMSRDTIPRATSALHTIQRLGDSLGTAFLAVVLQLALNANVPQLGGAALEPLAEQRRIQLLPALSHAFGQAFWVVFALGVITLIPAMLLPRRPNSATERPGH